jgi:hypothetical protein
VYMFDSVLLLTGGQLPLLQRRPPTSPRAGTFTSAPTTINSAGKSVQRRQIIGKVIYCFIRGFMQLFPC